MKRPDSIIAVISLAAIAVWTFVALPIIYLPSGKSDTFLGIGNTAWTAVGALATVVYCCLTAGLLFFAVYQVTTARADAKINRTLAACDRYDTDPVLDGVARRIAEAFDNGDLAKDPKKYKVDLFSIFNYFESIAIGVSRGQYDEEIVRDQLEHIIVSYVDDIIVSGVSGWPKVSVGEDEYFNHMMKLYREWKAA
ncbi:DUF4760 domain-containing protein [Bradyrhizobium diazoefficiens]|uniref:DUF4760 domain-containing protein n=1 Tax=Bradyrhizobium diazoefficiens TaxID=1355477 RepID=A0A810BJL4_9BRAD|nr:hypothetical protein XF8B_58110 [Bradyrhizobium diazoefficiens]